MDRPHHGKILYCKASNPKLEIQQILSKTPMVEDSSEKNDSIAKLEERTCDTYQLLKIWEERVMRMQCEYEVFRPVDPFHSYSGWNTVAQAQNGVTEYEVVQKQRSMYENI